MDPRLLAQGLGGQIPGSAQILSPNFGLLNGLPPAVQSAIAPNLGVTQGMPRGDYMTNVSPPEFGQRNNDPMLAIKPAITPNSGGEYLIRGLVPQQLGFRNI